jgi:hypothetical protein
MISMWFCDQTSAGSDARANRFDPHPPDLTKVRGFLLSLPQSPGVIITGDSAPNRIALPALNPGFPA